MLVIVWSIPMRSDGSLRRRITAAYALLAFVLCAVFATVAALTIEALEEDVMDIRLSAELDRLVTRMRQGLPTDLPVGTELLQGFTIPAEIRKLSPGVHEVIVGERALRVLVRGEGDERLVLADDQSKFVQIENEALFALVAAFLGCMALAVVLGRITASRVIAPLTALADAVQRDAVREEPVSHDATDEIGVLARAFAARTADLRRFLIRERVFTGDVSHELRTPLTVILGAAELLVASLKDRPELLKAAERIQRTTRDTAERVTALLLLSRSPEALDAPRIDLGLLVEQELEHCKPLLLGKRVDLRVDVSGQVWAFARPELASMAIGNLLRNACQFTEQGEVSVKLTPGLVVVEDTGAGIPKSVRDQLFERFVRGSSEAVTGTGLGLAIVKRVAEHLGWDVRLEDRPGGGSRFLLSFPPS
ncbi:MAG: HAMP domain-containing histidine kinase [Betaproteobacteria bacterium]|nr:HAMP domain-containing histidine kinase [Betaproteobacteria bacterium]